MSAPEFRCPQCRKKVMRHTPYFPFCSERCKLIDLGRWASDAYVVPGEAAAVNDDDRGS